MPQFRTYLVGAHSIGTWALRLRDPDTAIGILVSAPHHDTADTEISFQLHPAFWGSGCATKAIGWVVKHALDDLALPRVVAETHAANNASCNALIRCGTHEIARLERFGIVQIVYVMSVMPA